MGNNVSTKNLKKDKRATKTKSMPLPPRTEIENEHSTNTAHSVNSILLTSNNYQQQQNQANSLSQLNPEYPIPKQDSLHGKVENLHQHKALETSDFWPPTHQQQQQDDMNQYTVGSINQLTVTSISSEYSSTTNIDEYINRLLEAGYSSKVSKQLCLRHSEVTAICRAAMDIFLSQPVSNIY
jgi:serine/threonine-protein phosphatase PP1 catalytic subunit